MYLFHLSVGLLLRIENISLSQNPILIHSSPYLPASLTLNTTQLIRYSDFLDRDLYICRCCFDLIPVTTPGFFRLRVLKNVGFAITIRRIVCIICW